MPGLPVFSRAELLEQHLGGVVVAVGEHLGDDCGQRRRPDLGDDGRSPGDSSRAGATRDEHTAISEQAAELSCRRLARVRSTHRITRDPGVVDEEGVDRSGLQPTVGIDPRRCIELVVVPSAVTDDVALDCGDPRLDDPIGEEVQGRLVEHRLDVALHRELVAREQRVASTDEEEVAGHHAIGADHASHVGREAVLPTETIERHAGDEQLLCARREQRLRAVSRSGVDSVEADGDTRVVAE